jgi:hypothetical protein
MCWSSNPSGAAKSAESENSHHQRVDYRKSDQPQDGTILPLPPSQKQTIHRENAKEGAGGLVKNLLGDTPDSSERDFYGVPEQGQSTAGRHMPILLRFGVLWHCFVVAGLRYPAQWTGGPPASILRE